MTISTLMKSILTHDRCRHHCPLKQKSTPGIETERIKRIQNLIMHWLHSRLHISQYTNLYCELVERVSWSEVIKSVGFVHILSHIKLF